LTLAGHAAVGGTHQTAHPSSTGSQEGRRREEDVRWHRLLNGNLLVGVRKDSLLVRLGPDQSEEALTAAHVSEFTIAGRGTMKGWVVVGLEGVQSDDQLRGWVRRAVKFVGKLPAK
jgi:hypothetical protein